MKNSNKISGLLLLIMVVACVKNTEFNQLKTVCNSELKANINFSELEGLLGDGAVQIQEDLVLEGYVISSDKSGNFFGVLRIQDAPVNPVHGLVIEMDFRESHLFFHKGTKVMVKLKGLYLGKSGETLKLGGTFTSFGNVSVGRLPGLKVMEHVFLSCDGLTEIQPTKIIISEIENATVNTLVQLEEVEFLEEELGQSFALPEEETIRTLKDCAENELTLLNSGYADFQAEILPEGKGSITGILVKDGKQLQLVIRDLEDINFTQERCPEIITEFTSTQIFISELADPDNNAGARFVELYNSASEPLDLNLWTLRRYTNDNTEVSSTIDLSGLVIGAGGTLVISPNAAEFELVYVFTPDLGVSTNSPADSNGDDNLELVDPFGTVIDVFGVIGEDGSGTNHEFEDGRALRNLDILEGNPSYTFGEWTIFNDTGNSGTTDLPQNAPEDFTPGTRD
ncbi:lamin tail domain-containing protein [Flagellimonas alvinocaridis]|uniref:Lamin tail domain-containing protein n=1 Tax=Flagellimonas alvinocaridis TaxID=2530200 RepID=A0A4S8RRX6_9FLAO|nr:DUF5689 domain-containing protein [Allomuricauda alvinocaridis]THV61478.1 lamin tail domain-containing protein [Allomuricauda alvinocaridis]